LILFSKGEKWPVQHPNGGQLARPRFSPPEFVALVAALCMLIAMERFSTVRPWSDFIAQYAAAQLVGTADLYRYEAVKNIEESLERPFVRTLAERGAIPLPRPFWRPPFYAAAVWPLAKLTYPRALQVWQMINLLALAAFLMLWARDPLKAAVFCLWFIPTEDNIMLGQDMFLVLLCVAGSYLCWTRGWHFAAGLLLSLCSIKPHLFLLLPVLIAARRLWSMLAGIVVGGMALLLVSCLIAGWGWTSEYFQFLRQASVLVGSEERFANLVGLFTNVPWLAWLRIPSIVCVAASVWLAGRRAPLNLALGLTLAGGLVVSPRALIYDAVILLPVLICLVELGCHSYFTFVAAGFGLAHLLMPFNPIMGQFWVVVIFAVAWRAAAVFSRTPQVAPSGLPTLRM
jgi:hypothetical protein